MPSFYDFLSFFFGTFRRTRHVKCQRQFRQGNLRASFPILVMQKIQKKMEEGSDYRHLYSRLLEKPQKFIISFGFPNGLMTFKTVLVFRGRSRRNSRNPSGGARGRPRVRFSCLRKRENHPLKISIWWEEEEEKNINPPCCIFSPPCFYCPGAIIKDKNRRILNEGFAEVNHPPAEDNSGNQPLTATEMTLSTLYLPPSIQFFPGLLKSLAHRFFFVIGDICVRPRTTESSSWMDMHKSTN